MNYIWSYESEDYTIFDYPHYTCSSCSKQALGYRMVKCKKYFCKICQEPALGHNWWSYDKEGSNKQRPTLEIT